MSEPAGPTDSTDTPGECQTCNQAPGEPWRLEFEAEDGAKRLDLCLCDDCADELAAESWIDASAR